MIYEEENRKDYHGHSKLVLKEKRTQNVVCVIKYKFHSGDMYFDLPIKLLDI